jgi:hypothetical protein
MVTGLFLLGFRLGIGPVCLFKLISFAGESGKTSIAIRTLSEENYVRYMKAIGVVLIVIDFGLIVRALVWT